MPSIISIESLARGDERDGSPVVFRFRRSGDSAAELNVPYQLYGTALPGIDYQGAAVGSVNFGVGSTEAKLSLNSIPDLVVDPGETILAKIMPSDSNLYKIEAGKQFATETITAEGMVVIPRSESRPGLTEVERRNNDSAAALKRDGSVVLWGGLGDTPFWIDNNQNIQDVSSELSEGVVQIYATTDAFAALKLDGSVVTWGDTIGGNSSKVGDELSSGVVQISASTDAFAVLKDDGSVVRWGFEYESGYDSSNFASNLDNELKSNVVKIFSNLRAFAALKTNGSVVCWGDLYYGGDNNKVSKDLQSGVVEIFSTSSAFAALKSNGSVITWGEIKAGADSSKVQDLLKLGVVSIASTDFAFAALKDDGSVVSWGNKEYGGTSDNILGLKSSMSNIYSNYAAFAAIKEDGSVISWGDPRYGGDSSKVSKDLQSGVIQIFKTDSSFAALKSDGSLVTWGNPQEGGDSSSVSSKINKGVVHVYSTPSAFAALKNDGSVVTWGNQQEGGDSSSVSAQLNSGVTQIFSTGAAFVALKNDGSVITWGFPSYGGDSSSVANSLADIVAFANPITDDRLAETYLIKPTVSIINEGGQFSTNINTTNVANGTKLYWEFSGKGITSDDFDGGDLTGIALISNSKYSFPTSIRNDSLTEGSELLEIKLYSDDQRKNQIGNTSKVLINDSSRNPATYIINTSASIVKEGEILTVEVSTTNLDAGTMLYYRIDGRGINTADLSEGFLLGEGKIGADGKYLFSIKIGEDKFIEGKETLEIRIFSNKERTLQAGFTKRVTLIDTPIPIPNPDPLVGPVLLEVFPGSGDFDVEITDNLVLIFSESIVAGDGLIILRSSDDGETLSLAAKDGIITENQVYFQLKGFLKHGNSYTVSIQGEPFKDTAGMSWAGFSNTDYTFSTISLPPPTYTINTSPFVIKEGEVLAINVSTTNLDAGTKLYYRIEGRGINTADLSEGFLEGEAKIGADGKYSFSIKIGEDKATEGKETLEIRLFANKERTLQVGSTKSVTILETPIPNPNPDPLVGPVLLEVYPGNGDLDVGITDNLVFIFSESIVAGEGLIILKSSDDGETLRIAAKDGIIFENEVYFQLEGFIKQGNSYTVSTQGEPFKDTAGMSWAGFTNIDYTFSTVPLTPPASIALKSDVGTLTLFSAKLKEPLAFTRGRLYQQPLTDLLGINKLEPSLDKTLEKYYVYNSPTSKPTKANDINQNFISFGADAMDSTPVIIEIKLNDPVKADSYIVVDSVNNAYEFTFNQAYDFTYNQALGLGAKLFDENNDGLVEKLNIYMKSGELGDIDNIINNEYSQIGLLVEAPRLPVYRFYQPYSQQHFYTADINERNSIIKKSYGDGMNFEDLEFKKGSADLITGGLGYKYEGIAYQSFEMQATPLHRFYNPRTTAHFWTADSNEANNVIKNSIGNYDLLNAIGKDPLLDGWGYKYEGLSYKVLTTPQYGMDTAVYRFFQPTKGAHFYSSNLEEVRNIITNSVGREYSTDLNKTLAANPSLIPNGWGYVFEGKAFYI